MIEFKPEIDGKTIKYTAYEECRCTGTITLTLDSLTHSSIQSINAVNDETAEGLIRSALTAAANRNIFSCNFLPDDFKHIAINLGFSERNEILYAEIPFVLSSCSCCNCNN